MKTLILSAIVLFGFVEASFAQVDIHLDSDPNTSQNGQVLTDLVDNGNINKVYMQCVNISGANTSYLFAREIISQSGSFVDQLCDNNLCHPMPNAVDTTLSPQAVDAGDSTNFQPQFTWMTGGSAYFRYYVLLASDSSVVDSVDIEVTSVVGIDGLQTEFVAYPIPASDIFTINVEGVAQEGMQIQIYNLSGQLMISQSLIIGKNSIAITDLANGTYTYSIIGNGDIVKTQKLIVEH